MRFKSADLVKLLDGAAGCLMSVSDACFLARWLHGCPGQNVFFSENNNNKKKNTISTIHTVITYYKVVRSNNRYHHTAELLCYNSKVLL